jgi:hypothetical protein
VFDGWSAKVVLLGMRGGFRCLEHVTGPTRRRGGSARGRSSLWWSPFGHAEARIKVSREVGVWRAFGVVDKYGRVLRGKVEQLNKGADPTDGDDFHTYTIDWSPSAILWSVDGVPSLRQTPQERGLPLAIVLNLATDGHRPVRMSVDFVHVTAGAKAPVSTPSASPSSSASPQAAAWKTYTNYHAGDLVTFGGATYRVKEDHTALPAWTPKAVPDLFEKV